MYSDRLDVWYKKELYVVEGIEDSDGYMWGNASEVVEEDEVSEETMTEEFGDDAF